MTIKEIIEVLIIERNCVERQDTPLCDRNCANCDLVMPTGRVVKAYEQAIDILHQEPCDDAISRQAVLDGLKGCMCEDWVKTLFATMVKQLPSITQKSGKWIAVYQGDEIINYRCSECELGDTNGSTNLYGWDYCRRCGAKMFEPQESEDKG